MGLGRETSTIAGARTGLALATAVLVLAGSSGSAQPAAAAPTDAAPAAYTDIIVNAVAKAESESVT